MKLPPDDVKIFYEIQSSLYSFVNRRRRLFPQFETTEKLRERATLEQLDAIRQALYDDISLLDKFVAANPDGLPQEHLAIARTWRHFRAGTFYIFRYLKKHTVFLDSGDPPRAYGVLGLHSDFNEIFPYAPAHHGRGGPPALPGQDRLRRHPQALQHLRRRWHQAKP